MSHPLPELKKFSWTRKETIFFVILCGLGLASFVAGLFTDHQRAWANYLLGYFFWLCISLAGVFFTALQFVTGSVWSVTVRRLASAFIAFLPVAILLFIVLLFGLHDLYEWTHHHVVEADPILSQKKVYLNIPFFVGRAAFLFLLSLGMGGWILKNSIKQDKAGGADIIKKNIRLSAIFILLFAWAFSFVAMDLMMSLSPHWFSTIFGVYCWTGLVYSGLAMIVIWTVILRKKGILKDWVTDDHLHDLGKLMFAFLIFWTYIAFSQYMLIWYANLPEETFYLIRRTQGNWKPVSLALMLVKFVIPFFLLVSRRAKRSENWFLFVAFWFLAAQWLDVYWMVFPTFFEKPVFGWMEVGMTAGFAGLFFLSVGWLLSRVNAVAIGDPRVAEALKHHQ